MGLDREEDVLQVWSHQRRLLNREEGSKES